MDETLQAKADELFERTLEQSGSRDPREYYRQCLRELRQSDPDGYATAVRYYEDVLIPSVVNGETQPLSAWLEYGKRIAELTAPGKAVQVDSTGKAHPLTGPVSAEDMIVHIPESTKQRAILVGLPADPSSAQLATFDLLVAGKQKSRNEP